MRVELGAGKRAWEEFLRVDVNPEHADIVADALELPFGDRSVTHVRAVDILEHLSYRDTDRALAEWNRVLTPGGQLYVQVPDAGTIMRWYVQRDERLLRWEDGKPCSALHGAQWRLLGGHMDLRYVNVEGDWRWNAHYALFDEQSLREAVEPMFHVERLQSNQHPNLQAWLTKRP